MFVELSREVFEELKPHLKEMGISYEISDCTIPGEKTQMIHLEMSRSLSSEQIKNINDQIDAIYGRNATDRADVKDLDGNGIPDKMETDNGQTVEKRRRTWDDRGHTPGQEAMGYLTGENMEEEITYEHR